MSINNQYEIEAQGLSSEALAEQKKRLAAIKAEAAWRKRHQAKIDAGIVARAEAEDHNSKQWIERLRKVTIEELRKAEADKKNAPGSAPKKAAEPADSKADSRPVQPAAQAPQGAAQAATITPQHMGGRP